MNTSYTLIGQQFYKKNTCFQDIIIDDSFLLVESQEMARRSRGEENGLRESISAVTTTRDWWQRESEKGRENDEQTIMGHVLRELVSL